MNPLLETWQINDRLNRFLLEAIPPEHLKLKVEKAKSVGGQFSHIHSVRLMWLKAAAPELLEGLDKVEETDHPALISALTKSGEAMTKLIEKGLETGKIKGFKPHTAAFVGYLISHETHHRAHAELVLRQSGHPVSDKIAYGLWEWGVR